MKQQFDELQLVADQATKRLDRPRESEGATPPWGTHRLDAPRWEEEEGSFYAQLLRAQQSRRRFLWNLGIRPDGISEDSYRGQPGTQSSSKRARKLHSCYGTAEPRAIPNGQILRSQVNCRSSKENRGAK
jgi:hypothetical protein